MLTRNQFSKPHEEFNGGSWYPRGAFEDCTYTPTVLVSELIATGKLLKGSCKKCWWCSKYDAISVPCHACCDLGFYFDIIYLHQDVMLPVGVHPNDQT